MDIRTRKTKTKMADEDEIDILGDFSFNSCLAQNEQGIPSCSSREDTVHPGWFMEATLNNWYDKDDYSEQQSPHITWTSAERELLVKEMNKYGRNAKKISQTLTTKTEAEIITLIDAEYGINLDTPEQGLQVSSIDCENIPSVVHEEVIANDEVPTNIDKVITMVTTGSPTVPIRKTNKIICPNKGTNNAKSLLKPNILSNIINAEEIFYEDDLVLGSVELVTSDSKECKPKPKVLKKLGNHRRKVFPDRLKTVPKMKSPVRQRKTSNISSDSGKSPKLQIVLGSGQALRISEGEQVIKIEKKNNSESESDIDIEVDSDREEGDHKVLENNNNPLVRVNGNYNGKQLRKFEPMPRRKKKFNLEGSGGCTIMHTESGDMYEIAVEPKKEKTKKPPVSLIPCRLYGTHTPAPYAVSMGISAWICMELQSHGSRGEVMGLLGGHVGDLGGHVGEVHVTTYWPTRAAAGATHCDMCPVSQAAAAERLREQGSSVVGWHHSHPTFPAAPSALDLRTQRALQAALHTPFLGLISSQLWTPGRSASHYKCIRVELSPEGSEIGYQFRVRLTADLSHEDLTDFTSRLREMLLCCSQDLDLPVNMATDICPIANTTYLEKCVSSLRHHFRSAGYPHDSPVPEILIASIRDIFR